MTREEGLREMAMSPSTEQDMEEEKDYVLKKLDITEEEWKKILTLPYKTENDYPNSKKLYEFCRKAKHIFIKNK